MLNFPGSHYKDQLSSKSLSAQNCRKEKKNSLSYLRMAKTKQGMSELLGMYITKKQIKGQFIPRINRSFIMEMKNKGRREENRRNEKKKKPHFLLLILCQSM